MPKAIIMYPWIYGTTKQYAEWIAEDIKARLLRIKFEYKGVKDEKMFL
jgi:flavodoxin